MKYYIKTFGCQQNKADSERTAQAFANRGMVPARGYRDTNYVIINTCMVRQSAENRVYGLVNNLGKIKEEKIAAGETYKIIVTGCMVGVAFRDKSGKYLQKIRTVMPQVDEFMPIEEVGFDHQPIRQDRINAWVPISNGCNNFCTFCIVPFTRGREISRPFDDIIQECLHLKNQGYRKITLLGQNVNSYGADLLVGPNNVQVMRDIDKTYFENETTNDEANQQQIEYRFGDQVLKPVFVKHLGRFRIPTLFPYLLDEIAQMGFEKVDFISSNPWDFSDELIMVIAKNPNITRTIHLPIQSGSNSVLRRMNRWYTREQYLELVEKMQQKIDGVRFTTDIIVGFCGESDAEFNDTVDIAKKVNYQQGFLAMYSQRPVTAATKVFADDVPHPVKKQRWEILENLINKPNIINSSNNI